MNVTIDNQCSDIELTSPVCFTKNATCHEHLPQQVDSKSAMRANFKTDVNRDTFGGVLLYRLHGKEDTSTSTQVLVIWGYDSCRLYSYLWLIEHESTLNWNEEKLERLHNVYNSRYNIRFDIEGWLLNASTKLKTKYKMSFESGFRMNIIISEEKDLAEPIKPLWVDLNR
jgi:hypothetical protein